MEIPFEITEKLLARFRKFYVVEGECWRWIGALANGYGRFRIGRRLYQATRVSWAVHRGQWIHESLDACHTCDNRPCINPLHIFGGTRSSNMIDCIQKGRMPDRHGFTMPHGSIRRGQDAPQSKLRENEILQVISDRNRRMTLRGLGEKYGVHHSTINSILKDRSWTHVERPRAPEQLGLPI